MQELFLNTFINKFHSVDASLVAVFAGASSDDGQIVDVAVASLTEESHFACFDPLRNTAVFSTASLTTPILDANLRLTLGFGVNVDVAKHNLAAGGCWKNMTSLKYFKT